jgi:nucleoside-diphosphate-sugar epimerase
VILIGERGFVGSAFSRYLKRHEVPFIGVTRNNYRDLVGSSAELLINAGGNSKKFLAKDAPVSAFELEVTSTVRSLQDFHYDHYIFLSSIDVYEDAQNKELNHESANVQPAQLSEYGFFKYMAELAVRRFADSWLLLRLGGMVGEGMKKNSIYDLVHGKKLWVHPDSAYQYIATDTVAEIAFGLAAKGAFGETVNICGDGVVTIREIAEEMLRVSIAEYEWGETKEYYEVNIDKLARCYPVGQTRDYVRDFITKQQLKMEHHHGGV